MRRRFVFLIALVWIASGPAGDTLKFGEDEYQTWISQRDRLVREAILCVEDAGRPEAERIRAARLLGEYRAKEAIELLLGQMLVLRPTAIDHMMTTEESIPCMYALSRIGMDVVKPCLDELSRAEIGRDKALGVIWVLRRVIDKRSLQALMATYPEASGKRLTERLEPFWGAWEVDPQSDAGWPWAGRGSKGGEAGPR